MGSLKNKVAIVTGGASGMGTTHARRFVEEGAKVVITDIQEEDGIAVANELGANAKFIRQDITSFSDWEAVVAETESSFGPINILVNNAAISFDRTIEEMTEEEYDNVIAIDQTSVFFGMKTVLPSMKKTGRGSIINVSSIAGFQGHKGGLAYVAAKFAVRGMTKVAAIEFAEYGIRVNSIYPGIINTPMQQRQMDDAGDAKEVIEGLVESIPLKRMACPEEVSNLVLYLASDESSYSTGAEFLIEGGLLAQ